MFGGVNHLLKPEQRYRDTWVWKGRTWNLAARSGPAARIWPSMAFDPHNRKLLLFGGHDATRCLGDTWQWDGKNWLELKPTPSPQPRWHFAMASDEKNGNVVIFGGVDTDVKPPSVYGDTWVWNGVEWHRAAASGPAPRFGHAMAYDRVRGTIILFGGRAGNADQNPLNDTWEWNGRAWTKLQTANAPTPRCLHALAYDEIGGRLLLFGGWEVSEGGARYLPDTWQFKNGDWTKLEASGPPAMRAHFMVSDQRRHEVVLFGGYDDNKVYGDTWLWNGVWRKEESPR